MKLDRAEALQLTRTATVARLATNRPDASPHLVPIVFAWWQDMVVTAIDQKPKQTRELARLRHIARDPHVTLLIDHYEDDWDHLWWVRIDGITRILDDTEGPLFELVAKYRQYQTDPPGGPVMGIKPEVVTGWKAR